MNVEKAAQVTSSAQNAAVGKGRLVAAGFLSAVIPGTGHFLAGRKRRGTILLLLFCGVLVLFWPVRLPAQFTGLVALAVGLIALSIFATVDAPYTGRQPDEKPSQWWLIALLPAAMLTAYLNFNWELRAAGFGAYLVPASSMKNTIDRDDRVAVDLRYYRRHSIEHGDIIVFTLAGEPGVLLLKRVMALPGDTIQGINGKIWVNGQQLEELYVLREGDPIPVLDNFGPMTIPPGKLFVLGDNRNLSRDSRLPDFGLVDMANVRGRAIYVVPSLMRGAQPRRLD